MKIYVTLSAIIVLSASESRAEGFWKQTLEEFTSPVTQESKYYFLEGVAFTAIIASENMDKEYCDRLQNHVVKTKPLGEFSVVGDVAGQLVPNALYAGAFYWAYKANGDELSYWRSVHMFKATVYSAAVTNALKYTVRQKRPDSDNRESFPSGHATSAFAFATVVATEHEWYWGVAAFSLAGVVAYSRINDNAHYLHDVIGGSVIGAGYGLGLHYLYKDKNSLIGKTAIVPYGDGVGFSFRTDF